jgi:hypothetical protein
MTQSIGGPSGKLPARDFEEIRLAEALERGRCPVCDARQESGYAALRGLAREGSTDRGLRDQMDKGVGFCQPHSIGLSKMELLQTSSQLATAVLLDAVLRRRLAGLKKLAGKDEGAWLTALGSGELCLDDVYALGIAAASGSRDVQQRWSTILSAQMRRLGAIQEQLAEYAHNSTSDRRQLITKEQQEACAASIRIFGGTPDKDRMR